VPGADFWRSNDEAAPSSVSSFRLDKYEVTVADFRDFVAAVIGGYRPAAGAGKHSHLNEGMGLVNTSGGYEGGWQADWDGELPESADDWNTELACNMPSSWTVEPGEKEDLPLNCASWYQAYAYCIWTGGFLPSEAEWNYAAAGGDEQRSYPWGAAEPSASLVVSGTYVPEAVGSRPDGDGRWGHSDLAGNLTEWTLDSFASYETPCVDCSTLAVGSDRALRGGNYLNNSAGAFSTAARGYAEPSGFVTFGFRCARSPN
jgi:formylglycine-generating enzyme